MSFSKPCSALEQEAHYRFSCRCKCNMFGFCSLHGISEFALSLVTCAQLSSKARTVRTHRCIISTFLQSHRFQNHAPHSSGKHIFEFQPFPCRCKCNMFVFWSLDGPLGSCFDRDMCLSEFALWLLDDNCAQVTSESANSERHMSRSKHEPRGPCSDQDTNILHLHRHGKG